MGDLSIFNTYLSIRDPLVLLVLVAFIWALLVFIATKPNAYIPLVLLLAPVPKLVSVAVETQTVAFDNYNVLARPGFSLVEPVIFCGACVALLRCRRRSLGGSRFILGRAVWLCLVSIGLSVVMGKLLYPTEYGAVQGMYALRGAAILGCFFIARHYAQSTEKPVLQRAFKVLLVSGNAVMVLGLLYYYYIGSVVTPQAADQLVRSGGSGVWRNWLFFFDYAYDLGFYLALILVLNILTVLYSARAGTRLFAGCGIALCPLAILLTGQRGNIVIAILHLAGLAFLAKSQTIPKPLAGRLRTVTIFVGGFFVLSLALWLLVFDSDRMAAKLNDTVTTDSAVIAGQAQVQLSLPPEVADWVSRIPLGDFTWRVVLCLASLRFFLGHPWGIGYGHELGVTGWLSHYELATIAVEQGAFGVFAFICLFWALRRFAATSLPASMRDQSAMLTMRCVTLAFVGASAISLNAITLWKFGFVYWTLMGACAGVSGRYSVMSRPSQSRRRMPTGKRNLDQRVDREVGAIAAVSARTIKSSTAWLRAD